MSNKPAFLNYLYHYAHKALEPLSAMLAENVALRDWKISVSGRAAVEAETARNFSAARTIEIEVLGLLEDGDTVAGELRIVVDGETELHVVDVIAFDAAGKIKAIRAYLGRGS
jgi:hypothetical protein